MNRPSRPSSRRRRPTPLLTTLVTLGLAAGLLPALTAVPAAADQTVVVSPHPDAKQPRVLDGRIYGIDTSGTTTVVGGTFTKIRAGQPGSPDVSQSYLFMFDTTTGAISSTFRPVLNGEVGAVSFAADGQSLYVSGNFTQVNGANRARIVQLNLDGSIKTTFNASASDSVDTMALVGGRLIVAGRFGVLNGQPVSRIGSLNPVTGATQSDFNLPATESRYEFAPYVQEIVASPDGKWLAVAGNFQKIGTRSRNQLALLDLTGTPSVANWSTDAYSGDCASVYNDSWIRGLDISPDSSYLVVSTTGAYLGADSMCDSVARWELPPTQSGDNLTPTWRNLTGGDTLWANHITDAAVYVGGHQRWHNNPRPSPGGDNDGPGAVSRPGIVALDPLSGVPLSWNPGRDRGRGVEAITSNDDYLFIGSDTDLFDGQIRQRLAVLPTVGGTANPQPVDVQLPVKLNFTLGDSLYTASFDGATLGAPAKISGPTVDSINWTDLRDGFVQNGKLHYFGSGQAFWSRPFSAGSIGSPTNLSSTVGYVDTNYNLTPFDQPYGVAETQVATYHNGRIYYVKSGDSRLWWRGYSLESGIIDGGEYLASSDSFAGARALDWIGDWLYAAWDDGKLYRFYAPGGEVNASTKTLVNNGSSINWSQVGGLFSTQASGSAATPATPSLGCTGGSPWTASYWSNINLTGGPNVQRCEADVNYNWGSSAPSGTNLPSDNFSARWTRTFDVTSTSSLQISATADDGVRAFVDGRRVIDSWIDDGGTTRVGTSQALAPGQHTLRIDYYERTGSARAQVQTQLVAPLPPDQAPDNLPGDTTVAQPTANQTLTNGSVAITGTATDNLAVNAVRVGIYDRTNLRWLQPDGSWGTTYRYRLATLAGPGLTSTSWSLGVTLPQGAYAVDARTLDNAGNEDPSPAYRPFTINTTPVDTTAPTQTVTAPTNNQVLSASSVTASGTATDNVGVDQVRVAVNNRATNQWLQANGTWGATYAFRTATLSAPGSTNTGWQLGVNLPNGSYAFDVRARDTTANLASASTWRPFSISTAQADTTAPDATVTAPAKNATVPGPVVVASGMASDNVGVKAVRVAVYNRVDATNKWLQANGSWGPTYAFRLASLSSPNAASTAWALNLSLPAGLYGLDVKAVDTANLIDPTAPFQPFVVGSDAAAPVVKAAKAQTTARKVSLVGSAADNATVRLVRVTLVRETKKGARYLRSDGSWSKARAFRLAKLSKPGASTTGWHLGLRLPKGSYQALIAPVDGTNNVDRTPARVRFRLGR